MGDEADFHATDQGRAITTCLKYNKILTKKQEYGNKELIIYLSEFLIEVCTVSREGGCCHPEGDSLKIEQRDY
jgi:hypothetical protein